MFFFFFPEYSLLLFLCWCWLPPPSLRPVKLGIGGSISPGRPPLSGTLPINTCRNKRFEMFSCVNHQTEMHWSCKTSVTSTLWTAVEGPALTGLIRDSSSLAANSLAMETEDFRDGEKAGMDESTALRSLERGKKIICSIEINITTHAWNVAKNR